MPALALVCCAAMAVHAQQNVRVIAVDPAERLTNAYVAGEWAVAGDFDGWTTTGATNAVVTNGALAAWRAAGSLQLSRTAATGGPDLDFGFNDFMQVRIRLPAGYTNRVQFEFGTTVKTGFAADRQFDLPASNVVADGAWHAYRLDLGLEVWWRDTWRDLRITPLVATGQPVELDYVEIGDLPGDVLQINSNMNFAAGLGFTNVSRLVGKHAVTWWVTTNTSFNPATHGRNAIRMMEESYQVYCRKLGFTEPFTPFDTTNGTRYKVNHITWYGGYWAGGWANYPHLNIDWGGLQDEGWGNPMPHEFGHCVQMAQLGRMAGGHWESHANYLRGQRTFHFAPIFATADRNSMSGVSQWSNYRPDHNRIIYADQRWYLPLEDYGPALGFTNNVATRLWRDLPRDRTLIEKLALLLPATNAIEDVAAECLKRWPWLDFAEKRNIRTNLWTDLNERNRFFWQQGAMLEPQQDQPGWWRVPLERAPDAWAGMTHSLAVTGGASFTVAVRGLDLAGTGEDWRWCIAAVATNESVRYSPVSPPGTQSFTLATGETRAFVFVAATPTNRALNLDDFHNERPVDKHADRLRYGYEVFLAGVAPAPQNFPAANGTGAAHPNGGGWVGSSASVAATAYVGPNAKVLGSAKVYGTARIEDRAVVQGGAIVSNSAIVSGCALVEDTARILGGARIRDRAWVNGSSTVRDRARVAGYAHVENTTVSGDAVVRGNAYPFGGTLGGTAIADHDYSMDFSQTDGCLFSHIPWGAWFDAYYTATLRKPRGLAAGYRVEEPSGALLWDEFGAQHALLRGAPARVADAESGGNVLRLDGVDDYIALDRGVCDTAHFTFSCWVKPQSAATGLPLLFMGAGATKALTLTARDASGRARLTISDGASTGSLQSAVFVSTGRWTHIAATLDGANGVLYVNGSAQAAGAVPLDPLDVLAPNDGTNVQACYVGRDWNGALFAGDIEDLRFFNVACTAQEVADEMRRNGRTLGAYAPNAAAAFDGTGTRAESGVRNGRLRTLTAWVKPAASNDVSNYAAVFDSDDERSALNGLGVGLDAGRWKLKLEGTGAWDSGVTATTGVWQHVALACNGSMAWLYINGTQRAAKAYAGPATDEAASPKCYRIGYAQTSEDTNSRSFFNGRILNARIHETVLTNSQLVLDSDGDGINDPAELDAGRNPWNPADGLRFEFNAAGQFEGWNAGTNIADFDVAGGAFTGLTVSSSAHREVTGIAGSSTGIATMLVRLLAATNCSFEWWWGTAVSNTIHASRLVTDTYAATGAWQTLVLPVGAHAQWTNQTITRLRFDPANRAGTGFAIDFIRPSDGDWDNDGLSDAADGGLDADGDGLANLDDRDSDGDGWADGTEAAAGRSHVSALDLGFEFNTTNDFEGWTNNQQLVNVTVSNGVLSGVATNANPARENRGLHFPTAGITGLLVRYQGSVTGAAQVFWNRPGETTYVQARSATNVYAATNAWRTLYFRFAGHTQWVGQTVAWLRFDPAGGSNSSFRVDWIRASDGDYDRDGLADETEGTGDVDGDGLSNLEDPDSDNDALPDAWEAAHGLNRTNALDAAADPDGDTFSNFSEYIAGTDPADGADFLRFERLAASGPWLVLDLMSRTGRLYDIDVATSLLNAAWSPVTGGVAGLDALITITNPPAPGPQFYRLKVRKP